MFNSVVFLNNFIHPYFRQNGFLEKNIKVSVLFKPFQRTHDEREFKVDIVKIKALKDKDTVSRFHFSSCEFCSTEKQEQSFRSN